MEIRAIGNRFEPAQVFSAYRAGLFPMPWDEGLVAWYAPHRRGVLLPGDLHVSHSLARSRARYEVRHDTAFREVMIACATTREEGNWIDGPFVDLYTQLFEAGWAHSVEAWHEGSLVGGLYGVQIGRLFAGESMFHTMRDASKVALMGLVERLDAEHAGEWLLDTQWSTSHLASLGVSEVSAWDYRKRLHRAVAGIGSRNFHTKG